MLRTGKYAREQKDDPRECPSNSFSNQVPKEHVFSVTKWFDLEVYYTSSAVPTAIRCSRSYGLVPDLTNHDNNNNFKERKNEASFRSWPF
jgi:hypothetical protein